MELRLADPLIGLSAIGDLGRGREPGQAARTCFLACRLARSLGADDAVVRAAFYAALLQHIGCVAHAHDSAALDGGRNIEVNAAADETDFSRPAEILSDFLTVLSPDSNLLRRIGLMLPARRMANLVLRTSCEVAESTARRIGLPEGVRTAVRYLSEWHNGKSGFLGAKAEEIPLAARIVSAAFTASLFDLLGGPDAAVQALRARAGRIVDPTVAEVFVRDGPAMLAELGSLDLLRCLRDEEPVPTLRVSGGEQLDEIAIAFGEAVDLKMPFTHGSARRAFELAGAAAVSLGLEAEMVQSARRAAALRDIGKAAISNAVLEKPGRLTELEWEAVRLHAYHSERVLCRSPSLAQEGRLAGLHHERQDGSGYHRAAGGTAIPLPARIIAVADAFVAMTQRRPYRAAIELDRACEELDHAARAGALDPDAVRAVQAAAHGGGKVRRAAPAGLTDRQVDVLRLIAEGLSNRQIAERLVVSPRTAEHHVQDIYLKLGTSSRAAAALFAVEHELL